MLLRGVDMADSGGLWVGKEAECIRVGLNWPLRHNQENPPSVDPKCPHHLFKGPFKYPVNTFGSKDLVKAIL